MTTQEFDPLFQQAAAEYGIPDWLILKAISMQESSLNPAAVNDSDPHNPSYGLMQISCRPDPSGVFACDPAQFELVGWPPNTLADLMDPPKNIRYGAGIYASDLHTAAGNLVQAIAMYNDYGARFSAPNGPYPNQHYVDRVVGFYHSLGGQLF